MRRPFLALGLSLVACLALTTPVAATSPGTWDHIGTNGATPPGAALNGHVYEMYATANALYVGGGFLNAGGIAAADRIAKWNGTSWSSLGATPLGNGSVFAIAAAGGKVYAGGNFVNAGGSAAADYLAVFDGTSWGPFCNSSTDPLFNAAGLQVFALQIIGSTLYVGGSFQNANGLPAADYLIGCDLVTGAMTTTVNQDGDFTGGIYDLAATSDGTLYAGGVFTNLDQVAEADRIAYYNGSWHGLGTTPIGGIIRGLHANGMNVYVSTDGMDIGGDPRSDHLVRWDGASYHPVGSNTAGTNGYFPTNAGINDLASIGSTLFAVGVWLDADGDPTGDCFAYFDGTSWHPLGSNGTGNGAFNANTEGVAVFGGRVFAGGSSTTIGGDPLAHFGASRWLEMPDARIGTASGGPFVGDNVFNTTGAGQSKTVSVPRGTSKNVYLDIQNEGPLAAAFRVDASGSASGFSVKYFNGAVNVTTAVKNGTFSTGTLAPGARLTLRMMVKPSASSANKGTFLTTVTAGPGAAPDTVKAVIKAT